MLPLYRDNQAPPKLPDGGNLGLWYDKFGNTWDTGKWEFAKSLWIKSVAGAKPHSNHLVGEACARLCDLAEIMGGKIQCFKTQGRFVTGLGREHPVENGFAWHHTLGVPYLPGSSVKGVVRAWAQQWKEADSGDDDRIFGKENGKSQGSIIFFDALPTVPPKLEDDVMTPHYSEYYRGEGPPADWYSPTPIPFLAVAAEQTFLFGVAPASGESKRDADQAMEWLCEALEWIGAGAKTAVGYGRFSADSKSTEGLRQKMYARAKEDEAIGEAATFSPIRGEMEKDGYASDRFMESLTSKWLGRMDGAETSRADRSEIGSLLAEWYQRERDAQWRKPSGKNEDKVNRIKKALSDPAE